jgi:uncharacterized protein (TIGR03000 family)
MLLRHPLTAVAVGLVALALPLTARTARGQNAGGFYYETYFYGYNPGYYARRYPAPPGSVAPGKTAPPGLAYLYYLPGPAIAPSGGNRPFALGLRLVEPGTPEPAGAAVQIDLRVPEGAQVWFDSASTTQTGTPRRYVSPPLTPGREYTYEVRVAWRDGGREVTESRRLTVRLGDHLTESFPGAVKGSGDH